MAVGSDAGPKAARRRGARGSGAGGDGDVVPVTDELRARALLVHERLCAEYGCPIPYFHELDPLSERVHHSKLELADTC